LIVARSKMGSVPKSVFESRMLALLGTAGLPTPVTQHPIFDRGALLAVVDFAFPQQRVAIEADGYQFHSGRLQWEADLVRRNAVTALRWRMLNFSWTEIDRRPQGIVRAVRSAIERAGE